MRVGAPNVASLISIILSSTTKPETSKSAVVPVTCKLPVMITSPVIAPEEERTKSPSTMLLLEIVTLFPAGSVTASLFASLLNTRSPI